MVWYATREDVMGALDYKETSRAAGRIDRALENASRTGVEGLTHRQFAPTTDVRYFDWPDQYARPWRLWLDGNDAISLTEVYSNGAVIPPQNWFLRRADGRNEPPYTYLELNLDTDAAFGGDTMQRAIRLTGLWGWADEQQPAGTVVLGGDATAPAITVSDGAAVGVGSLLTIGSERLEVTGRSVAGSGQQLAADLAATQNANTLQVADGTQFNLDEVLLVDGERMRIDDIAGDSLLVRRAWDGSPLAAHTVGTTVWVSRQLAVARGVLGTTAAPIADGAPLTVWQVPGGVHSLAVAEASNEVLLGQSGYARNVRSGVTGGVSKAASTVTTAGLDTLRQQVLTTYGRQARTAAV